MTAKNSWYDVPMSKLFIRKCAVLTLTLLTSLNSAVVYAEQPDLIWVGKNDQARSCSKGSDISLDEARKALEEASIHVHGEKKIHDKNPRIQTCGVNRGDSNAFQILKADQEKAVEAGFKLV